MDSAAGEMTKTTKQTKNSFIRRWQTFYAAQLNVHDKELVPISMHSSWNVYLRVLSSNWHRQTRDKDWTHLVNSVYKKRRKSNFRSVLRGVSVGLLTTARSRPTTHATGKKTSEMESSNKVCANNIHSSQNDSRFFGFCIDSILTVDLNLSP